MKKIYLFNVDHTLKNCLEGPIEPAEIHALFREGHVVGLCGNWARALNKWLPSNWRGVFSFIGPMNMSKREFMNQIKKYLHAEDYVMVGNDPAVFGESNDIEEAAAAGWRFIEAGAFAKGAR